MINNYYHDKPITEETEDQLAYARFVDEVIAYINYLFDEDYGNTIGLAGNWGDGKTSVINLIKTKLTKNNKKKSYRFNSRYFLDFILQQVKNISFFTLFIIGSLFFFISYGNLFLFFLWIVFSCYFLYKKFPKWIKNIKALFYKKDYLIIDYNPWATKNEYEVIEDFLKTLSLNLDINSDDIEKYIKVLLKYKNINLDFLDDKKSIKKYFEKIEKSLKNSNKKIIVFIDDMDRMTSKEIFSLLKLVKIVANFSNIIYILAYNKSYIVKELSEIINHNPEEYLEKIIVNEYCLPRINKELLKNRILDELDKLTIDDQDNFDKRNLIESLDTILANCITNLRKVYKILNAFNFHYNVFKNACFKINVCDLFYLTIIKITNLSLYNEIWNQKNAIFDLFYLSSKQKNTLQYEQINDKEKQIYLDKYIIGYIERNKLNSLEIELINKIFHEKSKEYDIKRINQKGNFDLYFSYNIPQSNLHKIKKELLNFTKNKKMQFDFILNDSDITDLNDLMYSALYLKDRTTNFVIGLVEIMTQYPALFKDIYTKVHHFYFAKDTDYINGFNLESFVQYIQANSTKMEINLLEWLLFDTLVSDGSSSLTNCKILSNDLEFIKQDILNVLKSKFKECKLTDIYSIHSLERYTATYAFHDLLKNKLLEFLNENDETIVYMLHHFTGIGHSSNIGKFYNLYIVNKLYELKVHSLYKERMLQITKNTEVMKNNKYINYYSSVNEFSEDEKKHVINKSIEIIERLESASVMNN